MNRLLGYSCYLAGPIDRCENGGKHWRDNIKPFLEDIGIFVLDPLDKPYNTGIENDDWRGLRKTLKEQGNYHEMGDLVKEVRKVDLRMVDESNFTIVYLDLDVYACGTYEELFWANRMKKPILLWCPQGKHMVPDWLFGVCPHELFFSTYDELTNYIRYVDGSEEEPPTHNRWYWWDQAKVYKPSILKRLLSLHGESYLGYEFWSFLDKDSDRFPFYGPKKCGL